ncbi:MAG: hypothetical protein LQ337_005967 [Flavoplaca oasis]|nr:MAG: hypothetical protein LQ337_005967 [Flavoplaca oasis]
MEAVAIIGCIAAVVSAYRDGGVIVDKIKQKRLARQAPPPPRLLEVSLARGPRAVEEAKESGVERFGDKYADKMALDSLKDILIDLQGSLIKHLRQAQEDDNMNDFTTLVDAADIGRIRTVTVLNDLYVRVAKATTVPQRSFGDVASFTAQQQNSLASNLLSQVASTPPVSPSNAKSIQQTFISAHQRTSEQPKEQLNPAKTSFLDRFRRKSSSDDNSTPTSSRRSSSFASNPDPAHQGDGRERNLSLTPITSPQATIDEDNPWATEDTRIITTYSEIPPNESFSRAATLVSNNQPRPSTMNRLSTTPTIAMLSPYEPKGGFCKSAYKMQTQEKGAMKLRNLPVAKTGGRHYLASVSEGRYWACSSLSCAYEGPARLAGKDWLFDDTVRETHGVRYRWSFLAKTHMMASSKPKDGRYDYGCVFCIYDGYLCPVFPGIGKLMAHIAEHRGKPIAEPMLQRVKCIMDKTASPEDDFDVNLPPLEVKPHSTFADAGQSTRHSLLSASTLNGGASWTATDETANVDPWRDTA